MPTGRDAVRQSGADTLAIAGLTPLSSCDWPDRLVATVFLQGCPWRCGYCHNASIVDPRVPGVVPWSQVTDLLNRRAGLLDGVVFSGGEPTRQPGLVDAIQQVKERGFMVGLHTGGAYPAALSRLIGLVDWVGLDIKAPPRLYSTVTGQDRSSELAFESLRLLLEAGVALQVRTTVDPTTLDGAAIRELTEVLASMGVVTVFQEVRTEGTTSDFQDRLRLQSGSDNVTGLALSSN